MRTRQTCANLVFVLALGCAVLPSTALDPCADVQADKKLSRWQCGRLEQRTDAVKPSMEQFFSISAGATFNIGVSLVSGVLDLFFWLMINTWNVFTVAIEDVWIFTVSAIVWTWTAFVSYAEVTPSAIGAVWAFWYPKMWQWTVVDGWNTFFLLGCLAFLFFIVWALLGLIVCSVLSLVLLALVAVVFVLAALLMLLILAMAVVATLVLGIVLFGLLSLWICVGLVTFAIVFSVGAAIVIVFILVIICLGILLFVAGWMAVLGVLGAITLSSLGLLGAYARYKDDLRSRTVVFSTRAETGKGVVHTDTDVESLSMSKRVLRTLRVCAVSMITVIIAIMGFLFDLGIINASMGAFEDFAGAGGSRKHMSVSFRYSFHLLPVVPDLLDISEGVFDFAYGFSTRVQLFMDWRCAGATAVFVASQLLIGLLILSCIQLAEAKPALADLLISTQNYKLTNAAATGIKGVLVKAIELMIASGSSTYFYMVDPEKKASCMWEGDIIIAAGAYLFMWAVGVGALLVLPAVSMSPGEVSNVRRRGVPGKLATFVGGHLMNWKYMLLALFGRWPRKALEHIGLQEGFSSIHWPLDQAEARNEMYVILSADVAAASLQMLPLGAIPGKMMQCANRGYVHIPRDEDLHGLAIPEPTLYAKAEKAAAYIRFFFLIVIPLIPDDYTQAVLIWMGIVVVTVEGVSSSLRPRAAALEGEMEQYNLIRVFSSFCHPVYRHFEFVRILCVSLLGRCGSRFYACLESCSLCCKAASACLERFFQASRRCCQQCPEALRIGCCKAAEYGRTSFARCRTLCIGPPVVVTSRVQVAPASGGDLSEGGRAAADVVPVPKV
eukprot:TRINITY_DN23087_c0_g1_i1.p1 TRINITY_DN23087_c0_g1~~TRINITY_DN23087_c0_g1_i1.p1  ORF type:complete len:837 (+),score=111.27 TRINITY_DN23087_c0_g1_i1:267-2777(+)